MAEPNQKDEYKNNPNLRTGYLYTNYKRDDVEVPDQSTKNKPFIHTSKRKKGLENIEGLCSDFVSRVDYGDLGHAVKFQMSFLKSFNDYFAFDEKDSLIEKREKIQKDNVQLTQYASLRESKYGKYVFYQTPTMKKPKFLSLKGCPFDINEVKNGCTTWISTLVEWVHEKHNLSIG